MLRYLRYVEIFRIFLPFLYGCKKTRYSMFCTTLSLNANTYRSEHRVRLARIYIAFASTNRAIASRYHILLTSEEKRFEILISFLFRQCAKKTTTTNLERFIQCRYNYSHTYHANRNKKTCFEFS